MKEKDFRSLARGLSLLVRSKRGLNYILCTVLCYLNSQICSSFLSAISATLKPTENECVINRSRKINQHSSLRVLNSVTYLIDSKQLVWIPDQT